jgi:hypothetical protein
MDPYRELLDRWGMEHYQEALRRATHCARGNVHRAEEALQTVLERMWRNRGTYEHRVHEGPDGQVYIVLEGGQVIPLTRYIVAAACRLLRRQPRTEPPIPDLDSLVAGTQRLPPLNPEELREVFERLRPCLDRLSFGRLIAVLRHLGRVYADLADCYDGYVYRRALHHWEDQPPGTRASLQHRGLASLLRCLLERGWSFASLLDLT